MVVTADSEEGRISVLAFHTPLLTRLRPGVVEYKTEREDRFLGIHEGFMEVSDNKVNILADYAILPEEADQRRAEEARQRARQEMAKRLEGTDFVQVEAELRKALLELKLLEQMGK
jgi:F-type H+-transporting ATPase subunit epsilon